MTRLLLTGAWGKMIHEKNCSQKSLDTVPLNNTTDVQKPSPLKWIKWNGGKLYLEEKV